MQPTALTLPGLPNCVARTAALLQVPSNKPRITSHQGFSVILPWFRGAHLDELKGRQEAAEHKTRCGGRDRHLPHVWVLQVCLQTPLISVDSCSALTPSTICFNCMARKSGTKWRGAHAQALEHSGIHLFTAARSRLSTWPALGGCALSAELITHALGLRGLLTE